MISNLLALVSLISFIVCICLAGYVYFKKVKYNYYNRKEKLFFILCLSLAFCWALIEFGYRSSSNFETASFWLKINVSWYFVLSFLLHFILIYTNNLYIFKAKLNYLLIYGPATIFCLVDITTSFLFTKPVKLTWGWSYGIPENVLLFNLSTSWAVIIVFTCLFFSIKYIISNDIFKGKYYYKYGLTGLIIPILIGLNTEWLFPLIKISIPELVVPELTLGFLVLWYYTWIYSPQKKEEKYNYIRKEIDNLFNIQ